MNPTHYKIHLEPDLEQFTFAGVVTLGIHACSPAREVVLHARELEFQRCTLLYGDGEHVCTFALDAARQEAAIHLPEPVRGDFTLRIEYTGLINEKYAGLYRSKYTHDGQEKYLASTQFEAKDARRAFPCFDQPGLKATFEVEYVIPAALDGLSNTEIIEEKPLGDGKKLVRFARTPKMSTYLVFFGIGEFEFLEDASEAPLVRIATTPGKREYGEFALDIARKSLQFGADYTGIPYPLAKCDYIAVPDSMGAMENFGAIRHSEDVLLVYPGVTPKARATLIAKIIAHEGIHMWFGDLVSPAAWKYLWLNEAFATYFTYVIPHHYFPDWGVWAQFFPERMLSGMERDALAGTIPIDLPNMDNPDADPAPTPSTAPIVYNKGAAVIRMLAAYLGETRFKQSLHDFLAQYQFEAATSRQFWDAIAASTGEPVGKFAETWIYQPGYPLVEASRDGQTLTLTQTRFTYTPPSHEAAWVIPVDVLYFLDGGETQATQILLYEASVTVRVPENLAAYKVNAGFTGFYRVRYPEGNRARLGELIKSRTLSAVDSLNMINDFFALVKAGAYPVGDYLQYLGAYLTLEDRYLPLTDLAKNLSHLYLAAGAKRGAIRRLGVPLFEKTLDAIGYTPREDESLLTTELRATLLEAAFLLESDMAVAFGQAKFQAILDDKNSIHRDILGPILKIGAATHPQAQAYLTARATDPALPEADRVTALEALGHLREKDRLQAALALNLESVPRSFRHHMLAAAAQNPAALTWLWNWFAEHLAQIEKLPLSTAQGLIVQLAPLAGLGHREAVQTQLQAFAARHPAAADSVAMALEFMAVNERLRHGEASL